MYRRFYGFTKRPFGLTPDPSFLYLTPGHRDALAQLTYGVQEKKGFILLTGEVGTGKTTLLRALLSRLQRDTAAAYVVNSTLSFDDLLEYLLEDLGVPNAGARRGQRLMALNRFLIEQHRTGSNSLLILDEAQNLDLETLEQIRLLSNFETTSDKVVQIILAGQPELTRRLALPELRQLRQRIALRCRIHPMTPEETQGYIADRLRIAGRPEPGLFTPEAVQMITAYSRGVPRVVNIVCDHCLVAGYANEVKRIDAAIARLAIQYLEEQENEPHGMDRVAARRRIVRVAAVLAAGVVSAGVAILAWGSHHVGTITWVLVEPLSILFRRGGQ
jgi:type II secretory pathway predicted ATPase ExeA